MALSFTRVFLVSGWHVQIGHNKLSELPSAFGGLTSLKHLWAEDNSFSIFPYPILKLTELRTLRLSGNQLSEVPRDICKLHNLTELVSAPLLQSFISCMSLRLTPTPTPPHTSVIHFALTRGVTVQAIDNNAISSLPEEICELHKLQTFIARGNTLTELPSAFGNLTELRVCSMSSNALTRLPESLGNLAALTTLLLNCNKLEALPASLSMLTSLAKVNIAHNALEYLPLELVDVWKAGLPTDLLERARGIAAMFGIRDAHGGGEEDDLGGATQPASAPCTEWSGGGASAGGGAGMMPPLTKVEVIIDGNPFMKHLASFGDMDGEGRGGVVALTDAQYTSPLVEEMRKKAKHGS